MMFGFAICSFQKSILFTCAIGVLSAGAACLAQEPPPSGAAPAKKHGLQLPAWAAEAKWQALTQPFEEAAQTGGKLMLQFPKAWERQAALAKNNANRAVAVQRAFQLQGGRANANQQMEQQIKALIPQYRQQYINILYSELQAVRSQCEVPKDARPEVYKAAEEAYDKALEEYVRAMYFPTNNGQRGGALRSAVRASLVALLEKKLPAGEFTKLKTSSSERAEMRKEICIECVIAKLDEMMRLTKEQRASITKSIKDNWIDEWESWLMLWQYEDNYLPQVDDALIVTHLTPQQRRIWQQAQKISMRGEMHSEFAGEFDAAYWSVNVEKAARDFEIIERLER